ncbi:MAG: hypothetical protein K9J30_09870 [Bacteroidales bacterium]|nr:hypothetical protein [Bacteroidales bacterium]
MNRISKYIGKRVLRKKFQETRRIKEVQNFETAHYATVLFDADKPENFPVIKAFWKFLESQRISSLVIGISLMKKPPEHLLKWTNFKILNRKQIKWYGKPKGRLAQEFYDRETDILFKICDCESLPFEFLVQLSNAKFKVGYHTEEPNDLDLMINPIENKEDIRYFVKQVRIYVNMLNPSK